MAFSDVAALNADADFRQRTMAAYATETISDLDANPEFWQRDNAWRMAAQPGFGDAYASAIAGSIDRPGNDPAVITDNQIAAAVQSIIALELEAAQANGV